MNADFDEKPMELPLNPIYLCPSVVKNEFQNTLLKVVLSFLKSA